jgi:hypothetical protein
MHRRAKARFDPVRTRRLNDFGRHAGPTRGPAFHAVRGRNLDDGMDHVGCDAMMRRANLNALGAFDMSALRTSLD